MTKCFPDDCVECKNIKINTVSYHFPLADYIFLRLRLHGEQNVKKNKKHLV